MDRDNPTGADNQQETESVRALEAWWVVGFIDGEGCLSISIHRNRGAPHGWQLMPAFHAYQHRDHAHVLEELPGLLRLRSDPPEEAVELGPHPYGAGPASAPRRRDSVLRAPMPSS